MATLELKFLGEMSIRQEGVNLADLKSQKGLALLCYLSMTDKIHSRSTLAGLLWPDMPETDALMNLRQVLYRMKALSPFLIIQRETLAFNHDTSYWLDVNEFENAAIDRSNIGRLQYALSLYRGDFLNGFETEDFTLFDEWALNQRAQLKELALSRSQILLAHDIARQDFQAAVTCAQQLLNLEPRHEETHRELMRLLNRTGQRSAALVQFVTCKKILEVELGVEPSAETVQLYEQIKKGNVKEYGERGTGVHTFAPPVPLNNLPPQATPLIGRLTELSHLKTSLEDPQIRLVSIVGMGGMGKSHLALALAQEIAAEGNLFIHGICFVPLGHITTRHDLVLAVAKGLRFSLTGTQEPEKILLHHLRGRRHLICLDNFEQLLSEVNFLEQIMAAAPDSKILLTTRERTRLRGEWVLDLSGLSFPNRPDAAQAMASDAVKLFERRARQMQSNFSLEKKVKGCDRDLQVISRYAAGIGTRRQPDPGHLGG